MVPPALGDDCFVGTPSPTVLVPCHALSAYSAVAPWNTLDLLEAPCDAGIASADEALPRVTVAQVAGGVELRGADRCEVAAYDMMGRRVAWVAQASDRQQVALPEAGIYVLRLSDGQAVKVTYFK